MQGWTREDVDDAPWVSSEDEDDLLEQKRAAKAEADRRSKTEALMAQIYNQSSSSSKRPKSMQIQSKQPNKDARARRPKTPKRREANRTHFRADTRR